MTRLMKNSFVLFLNGVAWGKGLFILDWPVLVTQKWVPTLRPIRVALWEP